MIQRVEEIPILLDGQSSNVIDLSTFTNIIGQRLAKTGILDIRKACETT